MKFYGFFSENSLNILYISGILKKGSSKISLKEKSLKEFLQKLQEFFPANPSAGGPSEISARTVSEIPPRAFSEVSPQLKKNTDRILGRISW